VISKEEAFAGMITLSVLPYFPSEDPARAVIVKLLMRMCDRTEHLEWLVERTIDLWSQWQGPRELRAIYCSKFKPADGLEATSTIYPNGIVPGEKPLPVYKAPALPPGATVSADKLLDAGVVETAGKKAEIGDVRDISPQERKAAYRFNQILDDIEIAPADREPAPLETNKPIPEVYISALDVERAVAAKPDRREELIRQARETLTDPRAKWGQKQMAREILRGFGEVA